MHLTPDNKRKIAVFDVDETLIAGTSVEIELIKYMLDNKLLSRAKLIRSLGKPLSRLIHGWHRAVLWKSYYLRGISVEAVEALLPEFFHERILPRVFLPLAETIPLFKENGFSIYLLSGTFDFLIPWLVDYFGADDGAGSIPETESGVFTGHISGTHPYYRGKIEVLERMLAGIEADYPASYAFGDSIADRPLLSLFGHPYVVKAGHVFRCVARRKGWPVIDSGFKAAQLGLQPGADT